MWFIVGQISVSLLSNTCSWQDVVAIVSSGCVDAVHARHHLYISTLHLYEMGCS